MPPQKLTCLFFFSKNFLIQFKMRFIKKRKTFYDFLYVKSLTVLFHFLTQTLSEIARFTTKLVSSCMDLRSKAKGFLDVKSHISFHSVKYSYITVVQQL